MTNHRTGTRDEWLEARLELLETGKELTRLNDDLARQRRELPWVRIDKDYVFDSVARGVGSCAPATAREGEGVDPRP